MVSRDGTGVRRSPAAEAQQGDGSGDNATIPTSPSAPTIPAAATLKAVLERLAACPWVRPEAVERGRARIEQDGPVTPRDLAARVIERVLAEQAR